MYNKLEDLDQRTEDIMTKTIAPVHFNTKSKLQEGFCAGCRRIL